MDKWFSFQFLQNHRMTDYLQFISCECKGFLLLFTCAVTFAVIYLHSGLAIAGHFVLLILWRENSMLSSSVWGVLTLPFCSCWGASGRAGCNQACVLNKLLTLLVMCIACSDAEVISHLGLELGYIVRCKTIQ